MPKFNWRALGEIVGLLSIVASLLFVGFQLKQDQTLGRSDLASDSFNGMSQISQTFSDSEFSVMYAKMLKEPQQLSIEEMIQINAFLTQVSDLIARECYLTQIGVYVECDNLAHDSIRRYFGSAYAQAWWRISDTRTVVELPDWIDEEIYNTSQQAEVERINSIQEEIGRITK